jgi:hypothetical protein
LNEESANGRFTPQEFATKAVAQGYKWVAYQWNDVNLGPQQQAACSAFRQACAGKLVFTVWLTRPFDAALVRQAAVESQCQGIILEGEVPAHRPEAVNWPEVIFELSDLDIPKAVVSNFAAFVHEDGTPWPEKAKPLIDDGWAYISECFISESPNSTPARTDFFATNALGWGRTQPMIEGWRIADYGDLSAFQNVSHWDAGNVL